MALNCILVKMDAGSFETIYEFLLDENGSSELFHLSASHFGYETSLKNSYECAKPPVSLEQIKLAIRNYNPNVIRVYV